MKLRLQIQYCLLPVILALIFAGRASSQIVISFNAPVYGQSLEGLSFVQLFNSSNEDIKAEITIRVKEQNSGMVVTGIFSSVPIRRGINTIDRSSFSRGRFSFGNNFYGQMISQTGRFPEGEYEYCVEVEITESKSSWPTPFFENCFVLQLQPLTPFLLINPPDEEISCNTRPNFIWQLPMPLSTDSKCRLVLTEIKGKQDIGEAINYNLPVINEANISGNQLLFPGTAPSLQEGKKYAWQVILYNSKSILKKSDIWTYEVKCEKEVTDFATDSYRELRLVSEEGFYVTGKMLRFSFYNPYNAGDLNYSIINTTNREGLLKGLPAIRLVPGLNKCDIDLSVIKSFRRGEEYLLKVTLMNNRELFLRFLFKAE